MHHQPLNGSTCRSFFLSPAREMLLIYITELKMMEEVFLLVVVVVVVGCCCRCCCPLLLLLSFFFFFSSSLLLVLTLTAAVVCCFHVCITSSKIINYYIITRAFSFFITRTKTILFSWWPFYLLLSHTSRGRRARRPRSTKCT